MIRTHVRPIIGRDIPIGRKGENLARAVDFSDIIAEIKKDYGDGGKIVVLVKRPNEDVPYPAASVDESDGLTWTPTETDTAIVGRGNAEVDYYVDDVLVKSVLFTTYTHDSIGVSGDTPEPGYDYMKQLFDALEKVGTGIVSVDMNKDSSITFHMSDGTEYTTEPLKGADGDPGADGEPGVAGKDGVSPTVATSVIEGGTRVTITDGTGEHAFDVLNGKNGGEAATPAIGDNGNWFINGQDTGKPSRGETGANGAPGEKGDPGPAGPAGPEGPTGPAGADGATGKNGENGAPGADGKDGVSPTVATSVIEGGTRVTITDATGEHAFDVLNGKNGGEAATPAIGDNGNWYINGVDTGKPSRGETGATGAKGEPGETGANGADGKNGADGVSPTVATSAIESGTRVTITDVSGAHAFDVMNGTDGAKGADGAKGPQGDPGPAGPVGPEGPKGPEGPAGPAGADGATGPAGPDGVSPTVTTTAIDNGTRVTITDAVGEHTFDVLNGTGGGGGGTTETFTVPQSALYYLFRSSTFPFGVSETLSNINAWHYMFSSDNTPATVTLDPATGAVTIDAEMLVDRGNTAAGKEATFGSKYNSEDGTWWGSLPSFGVFYPRDVSDENTQRLNGMKIEGISLYKDGKHCAEFSYVTEKVTEYPAPTVPQVEVKLSVNGLHDGTTVALGDRVHVTIRGHIAPALA